MKFFKNIFKGLLICGICYLTYQYIKLELNTSEVLIKTEYFEGPVVDHYHSYKYQFYFKDNTTNKVYRVGHSNNRCRISNNRFLHTKEGDYVKITRKTYKKLDYRYEYEITYNGKNYDLRINNLYEK